MRILALLIVGALTPVFAQYSATSLTRKVAPQPQRPPAPIAGGAAAGGAAATPVPVDPAKVAAEQAKKEKDLLEYQKKRAEAGSDYAQFELGQRYLLGNGVAKDEKLGREWIEKAAKSGNIAAKRKIEELDAAARKAAALGLPAK